MKSPLTHLGITGVVVALSLVAYIAWYSHIKDMSAQVTALQNEIESKTQAAGRLATARSALNELTGDEDQIQHYFVSQNDIVNFIDDLEGRGRTLGTTVNVLSVSTAGTREQPVLALSLSIQGSFDAVARTIGIIEYAPYDIIISKLAFGVGDKQSWHADLSLAAGALQAATSTKP
jgi:hypothetical protein